MGKEVQDMGNAWEYQGCLIPKDLYYDVENQVWLRINEDGTVTMGLTDVGQTRAGRLLQVVEVNQKVAEDPNFINIDPYGEAWIVRLRPFDLERDLRDLLKGDGAFEEMKKHIDEWDIVCMRCV